MVTTLRVGFDQRHPRSTAGEVHGGCNVVMDGSRLTSADSGITAEQADGEAQTALRCPALQVWQETEKVAVAAQ